MAKARLAGSIFNGVRELGGKAAKVLNIDKMTPGEAFGRFGLDAGYAVLGAAQTPGDFGDKLIAGGGDLITSAGAGIALSALPGIRNKPGVASTVDAIGSTAGYMLGQPVVESTMRAKDKLMGGEGLSPYDKANIEYEQQLTRQVLMDLEAAGLLKPEANALLTNDNTGMV